MPKRQDTSANRRQKQTRRAESVEQEYPSDATASMAGKSRRRGSKSITNDKQLSTSSQSKNRGMRKQSRHIVLM